MKVLLCIDDDSNYDALLDALESTVDVDAEDEILVTHAVATLRWLPLRANDSGWAGTERDILQRVDDFLDRTVEVIARKGLRVQAVRLEGDTATELLKAADERNVDVIITGAMGRRSQDFLVGSVAEKLLSASEHDLLLARTPSHPRGERIRVLCAVDDTDSSLRAIQSFADKCLVDRAAIEIVHVMPVPPPRFDIPPDENDAQSSIPPVIRGRADHAISRASELFAARGLEPRLVIRRGQPAREVLDEACTFDADLIVVGRSEPEPGTPLAGWRGTVTERLAKYAACSVFIAATDSARRVR